MVIFPKKKLRQLFEKHPHFSRLSKWFKGLKMEKA